MEPKHCSVRSEPYLIYFITLFYFNPIVNPVITNGTVRPVRANAARDEKDRFQVLTTGFFIIFTIYIQCVYCIYTDGQYSIPFILYTVFYTVQFIIRETDRVNVYIQPAESSCECRIDPIVYHTRCCVCCMCTELQ